MAWCFEIKYPLGTKWRICFCLSLLFCDFLRQERKINSGCKNIRVYHQRNKTQPVRDAIGSVFSSFPFNWSNVPRRLRTKRKRKFYGKEAVSRPKEKLDSGVFDAYLKKIWKSFPEDRKKTFTYFDSLWFSLYRTASKDKVLSWIKKEHIFSKAGHWSLLILCHFGESLQSTTRSRCMLLLDSLEMANPRRLEPEIRRFVVDIFKTGDRPETKPLVSQIPLLVPKVPQQRDGNECGLFVLYFINLFLTLAPMNFSMKGYPYFMKKDWFTAKGLDEFYERLDSQN
ncbi:probable ubiquitin-like-specific protease 2B isoform X2 [Abrus precatorius]|uniref:Probable ubiquitin-like-specific protease 2B isoform X2 n=1 Tax=Abrus precatorius TaxID=3816 RepID=A0A8B8K7G4_ABRPR|nr:probable ubiquitin-like-specific protease 2B isoform X2 [Abrus precatorius]